MKRVYMLVLVLAAGIVFFAPDEPMAQDSRSYDFLVAGELGFALSPDGFNSYYFMGYGLDLGIEYPVSPNWSIVGMFNLVSFGPSESTIEDWWTDEGEYPGSTNIAVSEGGVQAFSLSFLGKGDLKKAGARFFPYIKGGFGVTFASISEVRVDYNSSVPSLPRQTAWESVDGDQTSTSIIVAVGVEKLLGRGNNSLFLDLGFHMIMYEEINPTVVPITLGIKF